MTVDPEKVQAFADRFGADLAATLHAATVVIGDKLGLYAALAEGGPQTPRELAERTGCHPRLVEEWCNAQAASEYCAYEPDSGRYRLTPEQAACLADATAPTYLTGGMVVASAGHKAEERIRAAFAGDGSLGWHEHDPDLFDGTDRFFGARYAGSLVGDWIPALDGVEERLRTGARVADVACGHGASTILLAQAFPASTFCGFDYHAPSVEAARMAAADAGVSERVTFEVATADGFPGERYDLVCMLNAFHEMGDPGRVAARILDSLDDDGTWLLVEPRAGDRPEDNHTPTGRTFYAASTLVCVPNALSQRAEHPLGAQAGEARLRALVGEAGFRRMRRAAETPFMVAWDVRP
jgi:SAM-dependent methyltransferase